MCRLAWQCLTVRCIIYKSAIAGVQITRLLIRRFLDVHITRFFLTVHSAGERHIAVAWKEKHYELTKTVGIGKGVRPLGFDGRFGLGEDRAGTSVGS